MKKSDISNICMKNTLSSNDCLAAVGSTIFASLLCIGNCNSAMLAIVGRSFFGAILYIAVFDAIVEY